MRNGAPSQYYLYELPSVGPAEWDYPWSGLGQLPTSAAELQARIQAEIAEFLAARQKLERMRTKAITRSARDLEAWQNAMATQVALEQQLPQAVAAARSLQAGEFNLILGAQVAAFATRMESHLSNVRSLERRFGGALVLPGGFGWGTVLMVGGLGAAGLWMFTRRR